MPEFQFYFILFTQEVLILFLLPWCLKVYFPLFRQWVFKFQVFFFFCFSLVIVSSHCQFSGQLKLWWRRSARQMPTDLLSVAFVCVCVCFVSLCAHIWDVSPSQECVCVRQRGGGRGGGLPLQTCRAVVFPGQVSGTRTGLLWLLSEDLARLPFLHWPFLPRDRLQGSGARQKQVRNRKSSSQVRWRLVGRGGVCRVVGCGWYHLAPWGSMGHLLAQWDHLG